MSSPRRFGVWLVVLVSVGWPAPVRTQATESELLERLDVLRPQLEAAAGAAQAERVRRERREAQRDRPVTDTVQVGPLTVVAVADLAPLAAELFDEVWRESFQGISGSPSLATWIFGFEWRARPRTVYLTPQAEGGAPARRVELRRVWVPTPAMAKTHIRDAIATVLTEDFPAASPMRQWLGARGYPAAGSVYRFVATLRSGAGAACLAGDGEACRAALGLGPWNSEDTLSDWFAPSERRDMVLAAEANADAVLDPDDPLFRACAEDGEIQACDRLLVERISWSRGVPLSDEARAHALWHAARAGGPGAWERGLEVRESTPPEVLEAISGQGTAFGFGWRQTLIDNRPSVHAGLGTTRWAVFFWTLILGVLAMRSTRWRLG